MTDLSTEILRQLSGKSQVRTLVGQLVAVTSSGFTVDVGGGRIPANLGTSYLPEINEQVWIWFIDGTAFVMGPTLPKPDRGTVVSVSSGIVTLTTSQGQVQAPFAGTTPSAGQIMKLIWNGGPFAMLISTSPPPPAPPPAPGGGGTTQHSDEFPALDAGSYGSGRWWTNEVWASDSNLGAWFYGTKISDTIPAGAVIKSVEVYVSPKQVSGAAPNFALHSHPSRPGGAPSLSGTTPVSIAVGPWVALPTGWGDYLKAGGGGFGIGLNHGGYNILHSLADDGYSGRLRIVSQY